MVEGTTKMLTADEAAEEVGVQSRTIRHWCQNGQVEGAQKFGGAWMIPSPVTVKQFAEDGFLSTEEAAKIMGITRQRLMQLCYAGAIVGAEKRGRLWAIPFPIRRIKKKPGRKPKRKEA